MICLPLTASKPANNHSIHSTATTTMITTSDHGKLPRFFFFYFFLLISYFYYYRYNNHLDHDHDDHYHHRFHHCSRTEARDMSVSSRRRYVIFYLAFFVPTSLVIHYLSVKNDGNGGGSISSGKGSRRVSSSLALVA
jgi:hypothetical protein